MAINTKVRADLLWLARVIVRPVLANIERIVAPDFEIMLENVLVAVYDGSCICKNRLYLRLLIFVESWRTEEFECRCIVPIDIRSDSCGIRHEPCVIVGSIDFALSS